MFYSELKVEKLSLDRLELKYRLCTRSLTEKTKTIFGRKQTTLATLDCLMFIQKLGQISELQEIKSNNIEMNTNISWITTGVQNSLNLDLPDKPEQNFRVRILKLKSSISTDCDVSLNLFFFI